MAIVQDPAEAFAYSMPASAMRQAEVDYRLRVADIAEPSLFACPELLAERLMPLREPANG